MTTAIRKLVDSERGYIDRRIFADKEIYQQELEQVFGRCWLYVGHECQLPRPNDFLANYMGEDPILVTRDSKGKLHAFLNMCRHRGNRICRADAGNAPSFMCTYHGWTFATDGKLVGVPGYKEAYFEELDRSQWGLVEAGQLDTYKGLIFATWDSTAPSLRDYLGDQALDMDMILDRRQGGTVLRGGVQRWMGPYNWKFPSDNFAGDGYHVPIAHSSAVAAGFGGAGRVGSASRNAIEENKVSNSSGAVNDYYKKHLPELEQRVGKERARVITGGVQTIFPNLSLNFGRQLVHVWHPRGSMKTEVWAYCIVDRDAPQEVKEAMYWWNRECFGPSGNLEQDDMNNWLGGTGTSNSRITQMYPMNIAMGAGHEPAPVTMQKASAFDGLSENRIRDFYAKWAEIMAAPSWNQIQLKKR